MLLRAGYTSVEMRGWEVNAIETLKKRGAMRNGISNKEEGQQEQRHR
jgi:hypothetical protein